MSSKYILVLVLIAAAAGTGYYLGSGNVEIQERVITKEGEVRTQIVERVVTKTVVVQPDGTRTETETVADRTQEEQSRNTETDSSRIVVYIRPDYSLGVQFHQQYQDLPNIYNDIQDLRSWNVQLGRRLLGPIWAEAGVGMEQYTIGLRWEF